MISLEKVLDKKFKSLLRRGIILIDKKSGKTSHDEVFDLKKIWKNYLDLNLKVGHSGTLDPKVTGLLVCGLGEGTKSLEYILLSKKVYIAEFLFHEKIKRENFEKTLKKFSGKIKQIPPLKSAVKRIERVREIYELKILKFSEDWRSARVVCSVERGTYIRKLVHDVGKEMNINSSMGNLRRISAGVFNQDNFFLIEVSNLENLLKKYNNQKSFFKKVFLFKKIKKHIYSLETFFNLLEKNKKMKKIFLYKKALFFAKNGSKLRLKNIDFNKTKEKKFKKGEVVSVFYKNKVIQISEFQENFEFKNKILKKEFLDEEILKVKKIFCG